MLIYRAPIRRVIDLLLLLRQGGRLVKREPWQLSEQNGWREWEVQCGDGRRIAVDARVAVTAHRKGLVRMETEVTT